MVTQRLLDFFYYNKKGWTDGTSYFVNLIEGYCKPGTIVMDLGAGSGEGKPLYYSLKGRAEIVAGLDVDLDIYENRIVDFKVVGNAYFVPFKGNSFDLIYADYVLEHISNPDAFIQEVKRVLSKGGYFIFRTPNLYHYVPLVAKVIPARFKSLLANAFRNIDKEQKTFPVIYKMNTTECLEVILKKNGFARERMELIEKQPSYLKFNAFAFLFGVLYERVVNSTEALRFFRSNIIGVFRKI